MACALHIKVSNLLWKGDAWRAKAPQEHADDVDEYGFAADLR